MSARSPASAGENAPIATAPSETYMRQLLAHGLHVCFCDTEAAGGRQGANLSLDDLVGGLEARRGQGQSEQ